MGPDAADSGPGRLSRIVDETTGHLSRIVDETTGEFGDRGPVERCTRRSASPRWADIDVVCSCLILLARCAEIEPTSKAGCGAACAS